MDEGEELVKKREDKNGIGSDATTRKGSVSGGEAGGMERRYLLLVIPLIISCCVYILSRSNSTTRAPPTLVRAFVGFRHGSRAPGWTYANDKYSIHSPQIWPEGKDKLTKKGKMEAYKLGERLRERYGEFLGIYFQPEEFRAYSTLMDRTLMSGQLVLSSLFPPTGWQLWNENLQWQPIPLYPEYVFNKSVGAGCPKFGKEAITNLGQEVRKLAPHANEAISTVMKHAGEPNAVPFEVFGRVWDTVYFQDRADLPLPDWLRDVYPEKMSFTALKFLLAFLTGSDVQKKLLLYNYAVAVRDFLLSDDKRKMELHSWHDLNNLALMKTLGIEIPSYPEPTSCLILEMHNRRGQKFFEAYYYESYKSAEPQQLEMACGMSCSEADLEKIVDQYYIENYAEVCQSGGGSGKPMKILRNVHV